MEMASSCFVFIMIDDKQIILFVIQIETHSGIFSMPIVALAMNMLTFYCIGLFATLCKLHQLLSLLHNRLLYAALWFSLKQIMLCKIQITKSLGSDCKLY